MADVERDERDEREEKLKAVLFREEQAARQWQQGDLTEVRELSLAYYDRAPTGDEVEGQSRIVTSEYADTVESIMPALMRVFASGEDIVRFTPDNPGDEQAAREASDYVPHLFMRENEGFTWLYWFLKDALMYRLAWGAVDIEDVEEVRRTAIELLPADAWASCKATSCSARSPPRPTSRSRSSRTNRARLRQRARCPCCRPSAAPSCFAAR